MSFCLLPLQVASRELKVPLSYIHLCETSTTTVPNALVTAGSIGSETNGKAVQVTFIMNYYCCCFFQITNSALSVCTSSTLILFSLTLLQTRYTSCRSSGVQSSVQKTKTKKKSQALWLLFGESFSCTVVCK